MVRKIRLRRGNERDLPLLDAGEVGITLDTHKVFYGTGIRNMRLATMSEVETILGVAEGELGDLVGLKEIQETLENLQVYANETEFTATKGQVDYTIPGITNPNSGWIEVFVNGLRLPKKSYEVKEARKLKLLVNPDDIPQGTKVIIKWPIDAVPAGSGHASTHRRGEPDELNIRDLAGYSGLVDGFNEEIEDVIGDVTKATKDVKNLTTDLTETKRFIQKETNLLNYSKLVVGDDWTAAMQAALTENDVVHVPPGTYKLGEVKLKSNNEVVGSGNSTLFVATAAEMFVAEGQVGDPVKVVYDTDQFSEVFRLESTTGFSRYDSVLLQSQRDCLNRTDSGEDWTLGGGTSETHKLPFGEFKSIEKVDVSQITLSSQPIFPSYLSSSSSETSPAQKQSTVRKVDFVTDVVLRNFQIQRPVRGTAIRSRWAKNMVVDNVYFNDKHFARNVTTFVFFIYSLNCEARNCRYDSKVDIPANTYYQKNVFKAASSMYCGFVNCRGKGAGQTVDFSYFPEWLPSTGCYVDGCKFEDAESTGITSHGGTYMTRISGNIVTNTFQGIGCRSRRAIITNNVVIGNRNSTTTLQYGIGLYEGHAVDCVIQGNTVTNFRYGIGIFDAVNEDRWFRYTGAIIDSNTVSNCYRHVYIHRHPSRPDTDYMNVRISNNNFRQGPWTANVASRIIEFPEGVNGVTIDGNIFGGTDDRPSGLHGIYANADCTNIKVVNNQFFKVSTAFTFRGNAASDSKLKDKAIYQIFGNSYEGVTNRASVQTDRAQISPNEDPIIAVSPNGRRWEITADNNGNLKTESPWGK